MGSTENVRAGGVNRYKQNLVLELKLTVQTRTGMDHERRGIEQSVRSRFLQEITVVVNEQ